MNPFLQRAWRRLIRLVAPNRMSWAERYQPPRAIRGQGCVSTGRHTYWSRDAQLIAWKNIDSVSIGDYCSIASSVVVLAGGNHAVSAISTYPFTLINRWREWNAEPQPAQHVAIGNDVWIATGATVIGDVAIGDGAVIGAGAVVVNDVPAYAVAVGVPARVVRYRFSPSEIDTLASLRWWEWPEQLVLDAEDLLRSSDVHALARFAEEHRPTTASRESQPPR